MAKLQLPSVPQGASKALTDAVQAYNEVSQDKLDLSNQDKLKQLFLLDKITCLLEKEVPSSALDSWLAYAKDKPVISEEQPLAEEQPVMVGLEQALQAFGIHRDGSAFLKAYQFAVAAINLMGKEIAVHDKAYPLLVSEHEQILQAELDQEDLLENYLSSASDLLFFYKSAEAKEKLQLHLNMLSLSYAKLEAMKGLIEQPFQEYSTKKLGGGNNQNFFLNIDGLNDPLVVRVEQRSSLGHELALRKSASSKYFSQDFATMMVKVEGKGGDIGYQPVIISEYAKQGDLATFADTLNGKSQGEVLKTMHACFDQLSDFFMLLMDDGFYHPDIKLSNFLISDGRIFLSDRKTITDEINPMVANIESTPMYGAPKYKKCINMMGTGYTFNAYNTSLDMPSYMSYQTGMALKEFIMLSMRDSMIKDLQNLDMEEFFQSWAPITMLFNNPSDELINLSVLVQELTRIVEQERLTIKDFRYLLRKINLPPTAFMQEVESHAKNLPDITEAKQLLSALNEEASATDISMTLKMIASKINLAEPRLQLQLKSVIEQSHIKQELKNYMDNVQAELTRIDRTKMSWWEWGLNLFGLIKVPARTKIEELPPQLFKETGTIDICFEIVTALSLGAKNILDLNMIQVDFLEDIIEQRKALLIDPELDTPNKEINPDSEEEIIGGYDGESIIINHDVEENMDSDLETEAPSSIIIQDQDSPKANSSVIISDEIDILESGSIIIEEAQGSLVNDSPLNSVFLDADNQGSPAFFANKHPKKVEDIDHTVARGDKSQATSEEGSSTVKDPQSTTKHSI